MWKRTLVSFTLNDWRPGGTVQQWRWIWLGGLLITLSYSLGGIFGSWGHKYNLHWGLCWLSYLSSYSTAMLTSPVQIFLVVRCHQRFCFVCFLIYFFKAHFQTRYRYKNQHADPGSVITGIWNCSVPQLTLDMICCEISQWRKKKRLFFPFSNQFCKLNQLNFSTPLRLHAFRIHADCIIPEMSNFLHEL